MADLLLVEGDTGVTVPFALTDKTGFINTTVATSVAVVCGSVSIPATVLGVGLHSFPADSLTALAQGSYRAQVLVTWTGSHEQFFPAARAWTVEIQPHTRSRA